MASNLITAAIGAAGPPVEIVSSLGIGDHVWPKQTELTNLSTHDHIIVGLGTAGSVVATRLAEDRNTSVLALEAGGNPLIIALFAGLFPLLPHTRNDFNYKSVFDPYAASSQGNYTRLTTGKTLGGSATINHFLHTRGSRSDFDYWAEILHDDSWKYDNILKYFIKSERVDDKEILNKYADYHGTKGPMGLTRQLFNDKNVINVLKSFEESGNPTVLDLNANITIGYTQPQYMLADSLRQTPGYSYLKLVRNNPNFHVSKNTRVAKVLIKDKKAIGVEAIYKGKKYTLYAKKEVIICAGVFNTPQVLILSGIGPEDHLNSMNIDVISNLPVGNNLMDQVTVTVVHKLKKHLLPTSPSPVQPITKIPVPVLAGSVSLDKGGLKPDYQPLCLLLSLNLLLGEVCRPVFGYRDSICNRWIKQIGSRDSLYSLIVALQPLSRGMIRIRSTNPFDDPVITSNNLKEKQDVDDLVEYIKDFVKVGNTSYFKEIGAEVVGLDIPECSDEQVGTDGYWRCYVRHMAISPYHSGCTCPMGIVTDSKMNVKGFENLRVIDASVMPILPSGAPNAAVIMLAEKGADMIKSEWKTQ